MPTTTDLTTLKINYLSQAQYDNALANNQINPNELYFTPADVISSSDTGAETTNKWVSRIQQSSTGAITATLSSLDTSGTWTGIATKATGDSDGNTINTTYIKNSVLSGAYDIMYSSAANTPARLAANTTTTKKFLRMTGTGSAGAAPVWDTVTKTDVGLSNVTNDAQIPKAIGEAKGDIIYWSAASTPARLAIGTAGHFLKATANGPEYSALTSTEVTTALGFTPYNATNPNGYTTNTGTVTEITAGTGLSVGTTSGGSITTSGTINHTNSVTAKTAAVQSAKTLTWGDTFTIYEEKYDTEGHITDVASYNMTMPSNPNVDECVAQNETTTSNWRKVLLAYKSSSSPKAAVVNETNIAYVSTGLEYQPSTGTLAVTSLKVLGSANSSAQLKSDSSNNIYVTVNNKTPLVLTDTVVRSGTSAAGTINLGTSAVKWNYVYANYFNGDGSALTSLNASNISSGTIGFARLPSIYWANIAVTDAASYSTTPEVAKVKINGNTAAAAASSKNVELVYDSTLEVLNFVFT